MLLVASGITSKKNIDREKKISHDFLSSTGRPCRLHGLAPQSERASKLQCGVMCVPRQEDWWPECRLRGRGEQGLGRLWASKPG